MEKYNIYNHFYINLIFVSTQDSCATNESLVKVFHMSNQLRWIKEHQIAQ